MANLTGKPRSDYVRRMFSALAPTYDRANHWMTWGQDTRWRRQVLDLAGLPQGGRLLDVGTGTGDLALETRSRDSTALVIGADFTPEMMHLGHSRRGGEAVLWINSDALEIPFTSGSFDVVVSGYLLRNVVDVAKALSEQYRVLKPGGRAVALDTTPIPPDFWHLPARMYVRFIVPIIGKIIAGNANAYQYLPQSTQKFLPAEELAHSFHLAGFTEVHFRRFMGGTMAIHHAKK